MTDYNWGQGAQGAVGGAMTGAALGSVVPGVGTLAGGAVGGLIGGIGGLFGGGGAADYEDRLRALSEGYGRMQAPQMGPAAQGDYSGFRSNQAGLIAQLEAMARGEGPSAATIQMREAMDRASGAQASAAAGAGGRGVNAGAALRGAMNNTAAIQAQGARDTATMRAQEQFNAIGQLGQATAQGRAADENMNQFNAGQQNQMSQANLSAQLQHLGITTQAQLQALQAAAGAAGPGLGTQLLGAGASAIGPALQYKMAQKAPGMSPIAQGYAGGGGYYTPTAQQQMMANPYSAYASQQMAPQIAAQYASQPQMQLPSQAGANPYGALLNNLTQSPTGWNF